MRRWNAPYMVPGTKPAIEFFPSVRATLLHSLTAADGSRRPLEENFWREIEGIVEGCQLQPRTEQEGRSEFVRSQGKN